MDNPLHAAYYADSCVHATAKILDVERVATDTWRTRFECPDLAERILPGQFFMVRVAGCNDPLIGRPFAMYDVVDGNGPRSAVDFVYLVEGKMTTLLASMEPGRHLEVWGPLGNGFSPKPCKHLVMVAGGIGQTPFLAVAQQRLGKKQYGLVPHDVSAVDRVTLCYGARSADRLAGINDFDSNDVELRIATDDGSRGHHGFVTELLDQTLDASDAVDTHVVCCGPEPMMAAASDVAARHGVTCEVSLEEPMACGIGICFTCVAKVYDEHGEWDYKRTCVDGPVFDAKRICW